MHDSQLVPPSTPKNEMKTYNITIEKYSIGIAEHVRAWTINVSKLSESDEELNRKLEEVAWVVCIMYGIGGWTVREGGNHGGQFNADMFL
jgi:Questin oxidase-like